MEVVGLPAFRSQHLSHPRIQECHWQSRISWCYHYCLWPSRQEIRSIGRSSYSCSLRYSLGCSLVPSGGLSWLFGHSRLSSCGVRNPRGFLGLCSSTAWLSTISNSTALHLCLAHDNRISSLSYIDSQICDTDICNSNSLSYINRRRMYYLNQRVYFSGV